MKKREEVVYTEGVQKMMHNISHTQKSLKRVVGIIYKITGKDPDLEGVLGLYNEPGRREDLVVELAHKTATGNNKTQARFSEEEEKELRVFGAYSLKALSCPQKYLNDSTFRLKDGEVTLDPNINKKVEADNSITLSKKAACTLKFCEDWCDLMNSNKDVPFIRGLRGRPIFCHEVNGKLEVDLNAIIKHIEK